MLVMLAAQSLRLKVMGLHVTRRAPWSAPDEPGSTIEVIQVARAATSSRLLLYF